MTNAMKWFFGSVVAAIVTELATKDGSFALLVFCLGVVAAAFSAAHAVDTTSNASLGADET